MKTEEEIISCEDLTRWRTVARQPRGVAFLDFLSFLNPIAWWRIASLKRVDLRPAFCSAVAIVLPVAYLSIRPAQNNSDILSHYWRSPWTLAWTWKMAVTTNNLIAAMKVVVGTRNNADPLAWKFLAHRIQQGRAYRERRYDVYLPKDLTNFRPIMFFTGAYVEHVAYAEPASLLSDAGYLVVVVSAEPFRIIDTLIPMFNVSRLRQLQCFIEERHGQSSADGWVLAGHSMGSFACTKLAQALGVRDVVMWGSAPFVDFMADISKTDVRVLVIEATKDIIVDMFATPETTKRFWELLPATTKRYAIVDGTHSGFGNYTSSFQQEAAGIPLAEQHIASVEATVAFLNGKRIT